MLSSKRAALAAALLVSLCGQAWAQTQGPSSSADPYVLPVYMGVETVSLLTAGDDVGGYRMAGIPDGLGAFDNGDGTYTLLMNHEIPADKGITRAHGAIGAFVSQWTISSSTGEVLAGKDLIQTANTWDSGKGAYVTGPTAFARFCSADLAPAGAFYNPASGLGTQERIYLNGEESGAEGRSFAHIATGPNAGTSWQLPRAGRFSWENNVANGFAQDRTVTIGLDDSTPGIVYVYIGKKQSEGTEIERAGLTNGELFGLRVDGVAAEDREAGLGGATTFALYGYGDVSNKSGADLRAEGVAAGVTLFLRPEDGAWDPTNPNRFFFATTDRFDQVKDGVGAQVGRSRLWSVTFADITQPEKGGTIEAVLDGTEAQQMVDNICVDKWGNLILQEDAGNQAHNGKVWYYNTVSDTLTLLAEHDRARFGDLDAPASPPFSQDEEASGVIDASDILGPGWFLFDDQAHYNIGDTELYEGGQMLALYNPISACRADLNGDGALDLFDFLTYTNLFNAADAKADFDPNGIFDLFDYLAFVNRFNAGC